MIQILHGLEGFFEILFLISIGYILQKRHWFTPGSSALLTKLVMKLSLPLYMVASLLRSFDHDSLLSILPHLRLPFASIFLAFLGGYAAARLLSISKKRKGIFITTCFIANTVFIGLPVNQALFGAASLPPVMLYYMANTAAFWTLGVYLITKSAGAAQVPFFSLETVKKIFSPPLMGFLTGIALLLLGLSLPDFLLTSFQYVGNLTTPLSLMVIGMEIAAIPLTSIVWNRDLWGAAAGRFLLCPACVLLLLPVIPVTSLSAQVFTMQAAMPAMTQMTLAAKAAGGDGQYAAAVSLITILMGLFVIPAAMLLVTLYT